MELCTFQLARRTFGVDIGQVKEIVKHARIAKVPHAGPDIAGLVNIRGRLHLVVDLARLFGFDSELVRDDATLVLLKSSSGEALSVAVESIGDVRTLPDDAIEDRRAGESADDALAPDERRKARQGLAMGVGRTSTGLLVVLDPRGILPSVRN